MFFELKTCTQWVGLNDDQLGDPQVEVSNVFAYKPLTSYHSFTQRLFSNKTFELQVHRSTALPEDWHFGGGRNLGDIVLVSKIGSSFLTVSYYQYRCLPEKISRSVGSLLVWYSGILFTPRD